MRPSLQPFAHWEEAHRRHSGWLDWDRVVRCAKLLSFFFLFGPEPPAQDALPPCRQKFRANCERAMALNRGHNSTRRPQREKTNDIWSGRGKKKRNFGLPPSGLPFWEGVWAPTLRGQFFFWVWASHPSGLSQSSDRSGPKAVRRKENFRH